MDRWCAEEPLHASFPTIYALVLEGGGAALEPLFARHTNDEELYIMESLVSRLMKSL